MRDLFRFLFRIRNTLLFLVLLGISFTFLYSGNQHHRAQAISSTSAIAGTLYTWRKGVTDYANLKEVNERLAAENAQWRNRHISAFAPNQAHYVVISDTIRQQQYSYLPAKVVNATWHKPLNYLTLDRGTADGLHDDMGVIGSAGIVGIVHDVSAHYASVISVLNPKMHTSVKVKSSGNYGILQWDTDMPATASVVDIPKHARVNEGDTVVTMGGDGIFPADVPVGVVIQKGDPPGRPDLDVKILLFEDMSRVGYVYVVSDLRRAERDTLEKKQPRAMINTVLANLFRFVLMALLQVMVLDHMDIANGWMVPYLYVLFLLMLPFELPAWAGLLIGVACGAVIDMFGDTPGMHMSACAVMMYARIRVLSLMSPREGYEFGMRPTLPRMGIAWFTTYASLLIIIHHLWLFFVEVHRFDAFFSTFLRALLSAIFTLGLCLLTQLLTSRQERVRA